MLQDALSYAPNDPEILESLADAATRVSQYDLADITYQELERIEGYVDTGRLWRIAIALSQDDVDSAQAVVSEYPESVLTSQRMVSIGSVYYEYNYLWQASEYFEMAITLDPDNIKAWTNIGVVQADLWELTMAQDFLQQAVKLDPTDTTISLNLATVLGDQAYQSRRDGAEAGVYVFEAIKVLDQILTIDPEFLDAQIYKSVILYEHEEYDQARELLALLLTDHPQHEDILYYLGKTLADMWETDQAITTFTNLLKVNPNHPWASEELVELNMKN